MKLQVQPEMVVSVCLAVVTATLLLWSIFRFLPWCTGSKWTSWAVTALLAAGIEVRPHDDGLSP
jgi:hypothetical protein